MLLDVGLMTHEHKDYNSVWMNCKGDRRPPKTPTDFAKELSDKRFTNGADTSLVDKIYERTFESVIGKANSLIFADLGWNCSDAEILARTLPRCQLLLNID